MWTRVQSVVVCSMYRVYNIPIVARVMKLIISQLINDFEHVICWPCVRACKRASVRVFVCPRCIDDDDAAAAVADGRGIRCACVLCCICEGSCSQSTHYLARPLYELQCLVMEAHIPALVRLLIRSQLIMCRTPHAFMTHHTTHTRRWESHIFITTTMMSCICVCIRRARRCEACDSAARFYRFTLRQPQRATHTPRKV